MTGVREYLMLRLDAPMQAWGGVAMDPVRPSYGFPTRSALAGLMASALGWRYRDGHRTTALQDALSYAVREDRPYRLLRDYQTADLERIGREGWTRWGMERRGGGTAATGTHILEKSYLADAVFTVALTLDGASPVSLNEVADALQRPSRPLFLGRKACLPAAPIFAGRSTARSACDALHSWPLSPNNTGGRGPDELRCWYVDGEGPAEGDLIDVSDRRDFMTDRFAGTKAFRQFVIARPAEPEPGT